MRRIEKYFFPILIILIGLVITICIGADLKEVEVHDMDYGTLRFFSDGWKMVDENGTTSDVTVPAKNLETGTFSIVNRMPGEIHDNESLVIKSLGQDISVYIDGTVIYSYVYTSQSHINRDFAPNQYISVPLKNEYYGHIIKISYTSHRRGMAVKRIGKIYLGNETAVIFHIIRNESLILLASIFYFVFGGIALIRFIGNRRNRRNIKGLSFKYRGVSMILLGLWLLFQTETRQFLLGNTVICRDLNYIAQLALPIPFVLAFCYLEEKRFEKATKIYCSVVFVMDIAIVGLVLAGISDFQKMGTFIDLGLNSSVAFCAITVALIIILDRELFNKIRSTVYCAMLLVVCSFFEILAQNEIFGVRGIALPIGAIVFAVVTEAISSSDLRRATELEIQFETYRKSQKTLLASVSHEIRTPINAVLGMDEMIIRETDQKNIKNYALDIRNAGNSLLSLVNDILDFSKLESGKMNLVNTEYSSSSMIHDLYVMTMSRAKNKGLELIFKIDPGIPEGLYGDETRLKQIIVNILNNAVKYTPEGTVQFSAEFREGYEEQTFDDEGYYYSPLSSEFKAFVPEPGKRYITLRFTVKDTGMGIRDENMDKLFTAFERIDEGKNKTIEGTGLGMSICTRLLSLMGSRLAVKSVYGEGTEFTFKVCQMVLNPEEIGNFEERAQNTLQAGASEEFAAPDAQILVVDDTPMNIMVFRGLLKNTGMNIDDASGGLEGMRRAAEKKYDIIFMDQRMPGVDGVEAMHHIIEEDAYAVNKDTPIIMLTANAVSGMKDYFLKEGFTDYLTKPIDPKALEKMVMKYLPPEKLETGSALKDLKGNGEREEKDDGIDRVFEALRAMGLDMEQAVSTFGNRDLCLDIIKEYAGSSDSNREAIEKLFNEGDIRNYTIKVHALKSSSRLVGAMELSEMAKEQEDTGNKAEEGDEASLQRLKEKHMPLMMLYKETGDRMRETLERVLPSGNHAGKEVSEEKLPRISEDDLKEAYNTILEMAEVFDMGGVESVLAQLSQYSFPEAEVSKIEELKAAVREVNFEKVKKTFS